MSDSAARNLSVWLGVIATVVSLCAVVFAAGGKDADLARLVQVMDDHEQRIRAIERTQADVRADVAVIRQQMADLHRYFLPRTSSGPAKPIGGGS